MITFVGAGPGAADLITLRGQRLLQEADVVIYAGSLVNPELLSLCRESCRVYNSAEMTLEEVMDVMEKGEAQGLQALPMKCARESAHSAELPRPLARSIRFPACLSLW